MPADMVKVERVARSADELALLAGLAEHPADDLRRLVYADFLDDCGDPRGKVLRRAVAAAGGKGKPPSLRRVPTPWADLTGLTWSNHILAAGLGARRADILALARPALRLDAGEPRFDDPPPTPAAIGTTRLGGDPDLPAGTDYPTAADGVPFYFLGQFDLTDFRGTVAERFFPPSGLLSIFRAQDGSKNSLAYTVDYPRLVRLTPLGTPLARVSRPLPVFTDGGHSYTTALYPFRPGLRLVETLRLPGQFHEWLGVESAAVDALDRRAPTNLGGEVFHLLGHATHGNTGAEPLKDRRDWVQLILVPPTEGPDFGISDMSLSLHLPAADLRAGRFDRLEATFG